MSSNVSILNLDKFKNCVLFSVSIRRWGNRGKVRNMTALAEYISQLETEEGNGKPAPSVILASDRVKSSKVLIRSKTYDDLCSELTEIKAWCLARSMPSKFRAGMFVVRQEQVDALDKALRDFNDRLTADDGALETFLRQYPDDIEKSKTAPVKKGGLGPLFDPKDYPDIDDMRSCFGLEWYWLTLSVPENIPDALKAEENEKFKRRMMDAAQDIETALREEFRDLLAAAEERLTTAPGEKPKTFRDSLVGNIKAFIETFDAKNVFADDQLAAMVARAKASLLDEQGNERVTPKKLREYASVREEARAAFADMKTAVEGMIETKRTRKFELEED